MNDNDDFQSIYKRHQNFHWFAKYIYETVNVFGTQYEEGDVTKMYHGINKKMIFDGMNADIFTVLSTTSEINVALTFADEEGMVIELIPSGQCKYFDCCWISNFKNEAELLFVSGFNGIHFENITNVSTGEWFKEFIVSLRIIDTVTYGDYFNYDATISHKR